MGVISPLLPDDPWNRLDEALKSVSLSTSMSPKARSANAENLAYGSVSFLQGSTSFASAASLESDSSQSMDILQMGQTAREVAALTLAALAIDQQRAQEMDQFQLLSDKLAKDPSFENIQEILSAADTVLKKGPVTKTPFATQSTAVVIKAANPVLAELLESATKGVQDPGPLKNFQMTPELAGYNFRIRQLEAQVAALDGLRETLFKGSSSSVTIKEVREQKEVVSQEYSKLFKEKIAYVKEVYPSNPVYAMAIPRRLEENLHFCSAGKVEKMARLLEGGFEWRDEAPATAYGPGYVPGPWGTNEMGEKGHYFSKDQAAYLGADLPVALECFIRAPIEGVSISSVTECKEFGFQESDIEKGYKKLQEEYSFLQNSGLPPKDTEVVFIRPEGKLVPKSILVAGQSDSFTAYSIVDYYTKVLGGSLPQLHPSWMITL